MSHNLSDIAGIGLRGLRELNVEPSVLGEWFLQDFDGVIMRMAEHVGCSSSHLGAWLRELGITRPAKLTDYSEAIEERSPVEDDRSRWKYYRSQNEALRKRIEQLQQTYAVIHEIIATTVPQFSPIKPKYKLPKLKSVDDELCMVHLSDSHIGEWVKLEHTAGVNEYSWDIFMERKERLIERVDSVLNGHVRKTWPVKHCFCMMYGDMCTHESAYKGQAFRVDTDLTAQIVKGAWEIADVVRYLCSTFDSVTVYAVPGNHGETEGTTFNTDYMLYYIMQQALRDQPNLRVIISDSPYLGYFIDGSLTELELDYRSGGDRFNFIMAHGQQARRYRKTPYYGLDTLKAQLDKLFGVVWDRMMCGHHHTDGESEDWQLVPSWLGATDFSVGKLAAASKPRQLINGFHPRHHFTWRFKIDLADDFDLDAQIDEEDNVYTPHNRFEEGAG